jgi:fatty-acyl-CoA synthase
VERERVTQVLLVPSVLKRVLAAPELERHDLSSLRMVASGGEPVPVTAIEELHRRLPTCALVQVYGLSEFPTMMIFLDADHALRKAGSAGRACRIAEVRVITETGEDVAPGQVGEIICRSPATMVGYYGKKEATAGTIIDGWLHTGDLGHLDEEGFIYVAGRSKDMIITGGLNVYPAEVERIIALHELVVEAAVIGLPDERWGEIGEAFVVVRPGASVTVDELEQLLRAEVANYKIPRRWVIREEPLPRTTSGKVQKFLLRQQGVPA